MVCKTKSPQAERLTTHFLKGEHNPSHEFYKWYEIPPMYFYRVDHKSPAQIYLGVHKPRNYVMRERERERERERMKKQTDDFGNSATY